MKVKIKLNSNIDKTKLTIILSFLRFLNSEFKLDRDFSLILTDVRDGKMTTGTRLNRDIVKVLCGDRMLIDILRTLGHEWMHEFQYQKENANKVKNNNDIGGWMEDEANSISGILIKRFVKNHKELEDIIYR